MRIDGDDIAVGRDGGGRAVVQAPGAAGDAAARMGAEIGIEVHIDRFLELADQIGDFEQRLLHRRRIARVGPEIAVALFRRRKQRLSARDVEDDVVAELDAVLGDIELEAAPRRRARRRPTVDGDLVSAEMAPGGADHALEQGDVGDARRQQVIGARQQHGGIEAGRQLLGRVDRALVAAVNQHPAFGYDGHRARVRDLRRRLGDQRRDLRRRPLGLLRPARALADIDEGEGGLVRALIDGLGKKRRLLGAADDEAIALRRRTLEIGDLGTAELPVDMDVLAQRLGQRLGVQRHGAFTVADQEFLALLCHRYGCACCRRLVIRTFERCQTTRL